MIIGVLNQKGGVGKTTLAVHLADAFARRDQRVMLIDADPQASALDWSTSRALRLQELPLSNAPAQIGSAHSDPLFPVAGLPKKSLHKDLPILSKGFDTVIIDGPPRVYEVAQSCIMASDFVLIPVQPSPYDVWAAKEIVDLIHEASNYKPTLKYAFVINRKIVNSALGRDVIEALAGYPVRVLTSTICQRVALAESAAQGRTVFETDPGSIAAREILNVVDEIMEFTA
jgi:chromosome partitioning protein